MNDFCKMLNEEFLRRLLFRVQETMDFQEAWSENGYGWLVGPESTKKILDIDSKEVLIGSPKDLGIKENDLIGIKGYIEVDDLHRIIIIATKITFISNKKAQN